MIKKLLRRVLRLANGAEPRVVPLPEHGIARDAISYGARKVCEVLASRGFQAYVVGGAVRDLMLGLQPKDFDVATDATPEEVHKHLRRSRLIGRRFKLVHAVFHDEIVEVSTFRAVNVQTNDAEGAAVPADHEIGRAHV